MFLSVWQLHTSDYSVSSSVLMTDAIARITNRYQNKILQDQHSPRYESRLVWVGVHHAGSIWRRTVSWSRDNLIIQHVSSAQNVRVRLLGNSLLLMTEGRTVCTLFSIPLKWYVKTKIFFKFFIWKYFSVGCVTMTGGWGSLAVLTVIFPFLTESSQPRTGSTTPPASPAPPVTRVWMEDSTWRMRKQKQWSVEAAMSATKLQSVTNVANQSYLIQACKSASKYFPIKC